MKVDKIEVFNIVGAMRGMRNPMNSWAKNDSTEEQIGPNDFYLCKKLIKAGPEHRKFMRQIFISFDVTAPIYWWKEFDTYKVGTVANSTSTMHKLTSKPITIDDFEMDDFTEFPLSKNVWNSTIRILEEFRLVCISYREEAEKTRDAIKAKILNEKSVKLWKEIVRLLPESYLQTRTVTMSFENLYNIVHQRKGHKLSEWKTFIDSFKGNKFINELIFK